MPPTIVTIGVAAVALLALFGTMDYYRIALATNEQSADVYLIRPQGPRFREAVAAIPEDAVVGYDTNIEVGELQDDVAFRGTQYAIAPRLLRRVANGDYGEFVIGNYTTPDVIQRMILRAASELELELVKQFDGGVILYRRRANQ
jgi:hypothetical protein